MRETIWRHVRLALPDDWEMLQFSRAADRGRCVFADRYEYRLELDWQAAPARPDLTRTISDYASVLRADPAVAAVTPAEHGGWCGLVSTAKADGTAVARFGNWLAAAELLTEIVFIWPAGRRDERTERRVLTSTSAVPPDADGRRRWRAFGLDMRVATELELTECQAQPARTRLRFAPPPGRGPRQEQCFERLGMAEQWLRRPVPEWLRLRLPVSFRVRSQESLTVSGHEVTRLRGDCPEHGWRRLLGRRAAFTAQAWTCPGDGRVCAALEIGVPAPAERRPSLRCDDWAGGGV